MKIFLPIILVAVLANPLALGKGLTLAHQYDGQFGQYVDQLNANVYINWLVEPSSGVVDTEHIPMIWCISQVNQVLANPELLADAEIVLLFNEPDTTGQCGATPAEAALKTLELQDAFPNVRYWGSPSMVCDEHNLTEGCDLDWFDLYFDFCSECQFDFIQGHHYGFDSDGCSYSKMVAHLETFKSYGLPVWVTEFGCITPNEQQRLQAYQDWSAYFETDPQILAWFPWTVYVPQEWGIWANSNMVDQGGDLTLLGELYRDLGEQH